MSRKLIPAIAVSMLAAMGSWQSLSAQETVKVGIVSFLTGPAAGPFGIPGKNAADVVIAAINDGSIPAPYNSAGLGGAKIEPVMVDEAGSSATQVTEYRNLVQRSGVDAVVGYIALGRLPGGRTGGRRAEEVHYPLRLRHAAHLRGVKYEYVFRSRRHATMDNVGRGPLREAQKCRSSPLSASTRTMPGARIPGATSPGDESPEPDEKVDKEPIPKVRSPVQFGTEISTLLTCGLEGDPSEPVGRRSEGLHRPVRPPRFANARR